MTRAIISVAARMTSRRLPGKVMADINGRPMLDRLLERLCDARAAVVVATSESTPIDSGIDAAADRVDVAVARGSDDDLISRHAVIARIWEADYVLLAGADDPLLDPTLFDKVLERLERGDVQYVKTAGWPLGLNVWGWTREAMEAANEQATAPDEREHVVPFFERRPQTFPQAVIRHEPDLYDRFRVTVDNQSDLDVIRAIYAHFGDEMFYAEEVIGFLAQHPEIVALNADGLRGTAARDAIYSIDPIEVPVRPETTLVDVRNHVAVERRAAQAAIPERGAFAEGQAAAMLSLDQWLAYQERR